VRVLCPACKVPYTPDAYELSQLGIDVVLVQPGTYPTNIFASSQQPGDASRGTAYGEIGAIPGKMIETLMTQLASADAPNPHDVAEAIATLVAQPNGSRPARLIVGESFGADALNHQSASVQTQILGGLGLEQLAHPRPTPAAA